MKTSIITWNINSIRKRINALVDLINKFNPDIILLQEIKCENSTFPYNDIDKLGYTCIVNGQKSYNGTAILTKFNAEEAKSTMPGFEDISARYQEILIKTLPDQKIRIINIYAPQGQEIVSHAFKNKMQFYDCLYEHLKTLIFNEDIIILAGDYNIAYEAIDVHDALKMKSSVGFHILERTKLRKIYNLDMIDAFRLLNQDVKKFTWWDYRGMGFKQNRGMRIDNMLISPELVENLTKCEILEKFRSMENPSDHAPLIAYFEF